MSHWSWSEYDRMLGKRFEIHLFYERESAIFIDRKNLRKRRSSRTELLITLFEQSCATVRRLPYPPLSPVFSARNAV